MRSMNFYKNFIQRTKSTIRAARIPKSFSKRNNNVFSNEKHIIMQTLMQLEGKKFRDMPSFLVLLKEELNLPRIPHFTTINKFILRVKSIWIEQLIARIVKSEQTTLIAIDGTGFNLTFRSPYFSIIAGERNQFMQCVTAANIKNKLITAARLRRKKRHEIIDVPYLMNQTAGQMKISHFIADKAYDSEALHELAGEHGAEFIAPIKKMPKQGTKMRGFHRRRLAKNFPREIYSKRVLIESIFSAIKRRFGSAVYSRRFTAQKNELLFRIVAYNMEKVTNNFVLGVTFYRADCKRFFISSFILFILK